VSSEHLSESMEMYLKAMLEMSDREPATVGRLAERLGVTPVSANEMVRKLANMVWRSIPRTRAWR